MPNDWNDVDRLPDDIPEEQTGDQKMIFLVGPLKPIKQHLEEMRAKEAAEKDRPAKPTLSG